MANEKGVMLTHDEAVCLYNHLDLSILGEIRDCGDDYDNMDYLCNLTEIYKKCKSEFEADKAHSNCYITKDCDLDGD